MNRNSIKPILSFLFLVGIFASAAAQDSKFSAGAKVLGNFNKFERQDGAIGFGGGGFASYEVMSGLSVRVEALYVNYATKLPSYRSDVSSTGAVSSIDYKKRSVLFNSLEIPVMVQYTLPFMESMSPRIFVGGAYSYNFAVFEKQNKTYNLSSTDGNQSYSYKNKFENVGSNFKKYNTSILAGVGFSFDAIQVDVRYQIGFPNLNNFNTLGSPTPLGAFKTSTISVGVGYKIM